MWIPETTMAGKVAIGAGTLPSGASLTIGDTGGEDKHTQLLAELVAHQHTITNVDNNPNTLAAGTGTGGGIVIPRNSATTDSVGGGTAFNVLNPYKAGTWAVRSARQFYRA
jgi:microcystin-dependent protein